MMFDTQVKLAHSNPTLGTRPSIQQLLMMYVIKPTKWVKEAKAMPKLLHLGPDLRARPNLAQDIIVGITKRPMLRLVFQDGHAIECTEEQGFLVNDCWCYASETKEGDAFAKVLFKSVVKGQLRGIGAKRFVKEYKVKMQGQPCEDCRAPANEWMEIHHNDLNGGHDRPQDLAWLCNKCHKLRHTKDRQPFSHGLVLDKPLILMRKYPIEDAVPFSINMKGLGNYVLANGIVTSNHPYNETS